MNDNFRDQQLLPRGTQGELLRSEFMKPLGLSANTLARALYVPQYRNTERELKHHSRYHPASRPPLRHQRRVLVQYPVRLRPAPSPA